MKNLIAFFLLTSLYSLSWSEWTGVKTISSLKAEKGMIVVTLKEFTNTSEIVSCDTNYFRMAEPVAELNKALDSNNYQARLSFLLAAYMAGKSINISYYDCAGSHIELSSVQFN